MVLLDRKDWETAHEVRNRSSEAIEFEETLRKVVTAKKGNRVLTDKEIAVLRMVFVDNIPRMELRERNKKSTEDKALGKLRHHENKTSIRVLLDELPLSNRIKTILTFLTL